VGTQCVRSAAGPLRGRAKRNSEAMSMLDGIIGVEEAAERWGLTPGYIKNLCAEGVVVAKKIGKTWVIDGTQQNPRRDRLMIKYTVTTEPPVGYPVRQQEVATEAQAIDIAETWAQEFVDTENGVYIEFVRHSDGQHGYINRDGAAVGGRSWTD